MNGSVLGCAWESATYGDQQHSNGGVLSAAAFFCQSLLLRELARKGSEGGCCGRRPYTVESVGGAVRGAVLTPGTSHWTDKRLDTSSGWCGISSFGDTRITHNSILRRDNFAISKQATASVIRMTSCDSSLDYSEICRFFESHHHHHHHHHNHTSSLLCFGAYYTTIHLTTRVFEYTSALQTGEFVVKFVHLCNDSDDDDDDMMGPM